VKGEPGVDRGIVPDLCAAIGELPLPVDWSRVRLYRESCGRRAGLLRRLVLWLSGGRACALGNHVFLPARCEGDIALMAHEMTHCAQYQAWGPWRYFTRGAAAQIRHLVHRRLGIGGNPYAYRPAAGRPFDSYDMEQQAQIVEDARRGSAVARAITSGRARAK
jgi:Domain of unknown function (DUF4157)